MRQGLLFSMVLLVSQAIVCWAQAPKLSLDRNYNVLWSKESGACDGRSKDCVPFVLVENHNGTVLSSDPNAADARRLTLRILDQDHGLTMDEIETARKLNGDFRIDRATVQIGAVASDTRAAISASGAVVVVTKTDCGLCARSEQRKNCEAGTLKPAACQAFRIPMIGLSPLLEGRCIDCSDCCNGLKGYGVNLKPLFLPDRTVWIGFLPTMKRP